MMLIMEAVKKFIPITEEEFREFIKLQNQQAELTKQELTQPPSIKPLLTAQNDQIETIFSQTLPPSKQEQRFNELTHLVKQLQTQVLAQTTLPLQPIKLPVVTEAQQHEKLPRGYQNRSKHLLQALGNEVWNENGELVVDGKPVKNSNRGTLTNFATTNWVNKYAIPPPGANEMLQLIKQKKILPTKLGNKVRKQLETNVVGVGTPKLHKNFKKMGPVVLNDDKKFSAFVKKRKTNPSNVSHTRKMNKKIVF